MLLAGGRLLHMPTSDRATMNESSSGALDISELRSPAAINFHSHSAMLSTFYHKSLKYKYKRKKLILL